MVFLQQYLYYVLSISRSGLFLMMMMNLVFARPTGLTLKLIHRDSFARPTGLTLKLIHRDSLYPRNLTKLERMERAYQQSIHSEQSRLLSTGHHVISSRNNNSTTNNSKSDIDTIRPEGKPYEGYTYMVELGIGTFSSSGGSPSYYNFYFDTGSDLLWLQCDATRTGTLKEPKYFKQDAKIFNRGEYSSTYNPLPYDSPSDICQKYVSKGVPPEGQGQNFCGYRMEYVDNGSTEGVLATEKLTIRTDNGGTEEINGFVFGCGYRQNEPAFDEGVEGKNPIAGILGLGEGKESFITQLGDRVDNKFEYCLTPRYEDGDHPDAHTFLRFGSDTKIVVGGPGVQTTRTLPVRGQTLYYATMDAILINGIPVVYPAGSSVFEAKQDGTGGCVFDSGTEFTTLSPQVFDPFSDQLATYFKRTYGISKRTPRGVFSEYDLCFKGPVGFDKFPTITFRFIGGDFVIEPDAAFASDDGPMFCLTMIRSELSDPLSVILGSIHQTNHRILHNVGGREISWVNEDCAIDP